MLPWTPALNVRCYNTYMKQHEPTDRENEIELIDLTEESKSEKFLSSWLARFLLRWQRNMPRQSWRHLMSLMTVVLVVAALLVIPGGLRPQPMPVVHSQTQSTLTPTPPLHYSARGTYRSHPVAVYLGHVGYVPTVVW